MNDSERYQFDLSGHLYIPGLLSPEEAAHLLRVCKDLEEDALTCAPAAGASSPRWKAVWGHEYWQSPRDGYFASGERKEGGTLMVEDFWSYSPTFDLLLDHPPTMAYIGRIIRGAVAINNSELRIRYPGNHTPMHMGFPGGHGAKYRYNVLDGEIDCMMVRMVYFLHDVGLDEGPLCVVPGSHKSHFPVPVQSSPEEEPGVVGISVQAGDAVLFTEACRHGGFPNRSVKTRYTLHVGYGPPFLKSQNIATMDEEPNVTEALLARLTPEQQALLVRPKRQAL